MGRWSDHKDLDEMGMLFLQGSEWVRWKMKPPTTRKEISAREGLRSTSILPPSWSIRDAHPQPPPRSIKARYTPQQPSSGVKPPSATP